MNETYEKRNTEKGIEVWICFPETKLNRRLALFYTQFFDNENFSESDNNASFFIKELEKARDMLNDIFADMDKEK